MSKAKNLIHKWHEVIESDDLKMLDEIIADDAVFSSPVVFKNGRQRNHNDVSSCCRSVF